MRLKARGRAGKKKKKISLHFPGYMLQRTVCVFENPHEKVSCLNNCSLWINWLSFLPATTSNNSERSLEKPVQTLMLSTKRV